MREIFEKDGNGPDEGCQESRISIDRIRLQQRFRKKGEDQCTQKRCSGAEPVLGNFIYTCNHQDGCGQ